MAVTISGTTGVGVSTTPSYPIDIAVGTLGTTENSQLIGAKLQGIAGTNGDNLEISQVRGTAGTTWTTAGWRIQEKVDATWMGYIQFNGTSSGANNNGISIGTGSSTVNANSVTERLRIDGNGNVTVNSGNLIFGGTAQRITGDFSNATIVSRLLLQSSTVNGATNVFAIPNGTGSSSFWLNSNSSDPANASLSYVGVDATKVSFNSDKTGTGTYLPMTFYTSGAERMRIDTSGGVSVVGDMQATSYNGGQLAGLRNKIINGNMGIFQRGTTAVTVSGLYGPADRWSTGVTGDTFSTTQGSFVGGDTLYDTGAAQYFTTVAVTSVPAAANNAVLQQYIEDVRVLAGQTVTLSFWAKAAAGTPSIGISLDQNFGIGGTPSAVVQGTGQAQVLTTTWTKYTNTFTVASINGKTIGTTANTSSTRLIIWLNAGSNFDVRSGSIGQASKTVSIAQVQLEIGSVATPFEQRPIGTELALCQRYYEVTALQYAYSPYNAPSTASEMFFSTNFLVSKRATPLITYTGAAQINTAASTSGVNSQLSANPATNTISSTVFTASIEL